MEQYYLQHLHDFGLPEYDAVTIKPNFKIGYYKHGDGREYEFDSLSPGEKLRAKIGLYIALIELDLKHQFGRHPRFIILDSPATEEGDATFVEGLRQTLRHIETQFGDQVQVLVGTAKRELADCVVAEKAEILPEREFLF
jgi:hypothetical protein